MEQVVIFFAVYFSYLVIVAAGILILYHRSWRELLITFAASFAAWVLAHVLKNLIQVARPDGGLFLADGYAFPSGHATFFFALAMSIFFFHKKSGSWLLFFALLISLARILAGVHSPLDILGGIILGSLAAYSTRYLSTRFATSPEKV